MISRRLLLAAAAGLAASTPSWSATPPLTVYKTASCGCCKGWITTMGRAGFAPKTVVLEDVSPIGRKHGVPFELSSCHLATIGGYVVVGHVPPSDVARLLKERPKAVGITVPGMPVGSPGMETPDRRKEAFETRLLLPGGKSRVFARHG